jgi:hypothetical protein
LAADPEFRDRFDREARTISRLSHSLFLYDLCVSSRRPS